MTAEHPLAVLRRLRQATAPPPGVSPPLGRADVVASHPALVTLEPDVEAVLVRAPGPRMSGSPQIETGSAENRPIRSQLLETQWTQATQCAELYVVPVDTCYELVGRLRRLWRGFDGGREANDAIDDLFARGEGANGFAVEPVPWDEEASFRLPVRAWRDVMDLYFSGSGWVRLRRETIDALQRYKAEHGLPTWDEALTRLLSGRNGR
jgi:hypothetical protein